jgi:GNAT superfamily N-acetyltransferase
MSLYSDYIRETKEGRDIIEIDNVAFVTFYIHTENKECYIEEMYVRPRYRKQGIAFKLLLDVKRMAREKNCILIKKHSRVKNFLKKEVPDDTRKNV